MFKADNWFRLLYCLIFWFMLYFFSIALIILVVVQFFCVFTGTDINTKMRAIGRSIALYFKSCILFVTFNSDEKPFPFSDWPK